MVQLLVVWVYFKDPDPVLQPKTVFKGWCVGETVHVGKLVGSCKCFSAQLQVYAGQRMGMTA